MQRRIAGLHRDEDGDWVAELDCGHRQHVRHRPPFQLRAWVLDDEERQARVGAPLECRLCDEEVDEGGEPACWAHLVCAECGSPEDEHLEGCSLAEGRPEPGLPVPKDT